MAEPTPAYLRSRLRYEPKTGKLFWRDHLTEKEAFACLDRTGYLRGTILKRQYRTHRVIWAMVHGHWPPDQIDHINGVRNDNRLVNLRAVTCKENQRNQSLRSTNKSGTIGVYWHKVNRKWVAAIRRSGKSLYLGSFAKRSDAVTARRDASMEFGFHKNHGRAGFAYAR